MTSSDGAGARHELNATLARARAGDERSTAALLPVVYAELRRIARGYLGPRAGPTLQPTALVHEAFLRLCAADTSFADRTHFVAVAAMAMRQILIDHLRRAGAAKRGGDQLRATLDDSAPAAPALPLVDVLALDAALERLAARSPRQARIVELQFFGGMNIDEVAEALSVSRSLVEKELRRARAWLRRELSDGGAPSEGP